jgi:hypothetical protein
MSDQSQDKSQRHNLRLDFFPEGNPTSNSKTTHTRRRWLISDRGSQAVSQTRRGTRFYVQCDCAG